MGSLVVRAVRAGGEGGNAPSSGQKTEGGTQVRGGWGRVAFTSGDGTARSAQRGQKTVPVVKGAGGTEGGTQQTARHGASGGGGSGGERRLVVRDRVGPCKTGPGIAGHDRR